MVSKIEGAHCDECPLRSNAFCTPKAMRSDIPYLFIGGGPSITEAYKGDFLTTTDAGKLTLSVATFNGIDRDHIQYTSSVCCAGMADLSARDKKKAIACCNGPLFDRIDVADPVGVVIMGADAAQAVAGDSRVTALRVGPARTLAATETPTIVTVSPWACIALERNFQFFVTDVGKLVNDPPPFELPNYNVITDKYDALIAVGAWLKDARNQSAPQPLVLDIEVAMEKDIAFEHPDRFEMLCLGLKYGDEPITVVAEKGLSKQFYQLLGDLCKYTEVTAHNGKFDLAGLRPHCGKIDLNFDTMLASYSFDERTGIHGLKYLAQEYLGAPEYDAEIKDIVGASKNFALIPKDLLYKYNAYDIHCTSELKKLYQRRLNDNPVVAKAFNHLIATSNMLQDVENMGMAIDVSYLGALEHEFVERIASRREELVSLSETTGMLYDKKLGFNPNSFAQVKQFLRDQSVAVPSTSKENLLKVVDKIDQIKATLSEEATLPVNLSVVDDFIKCLLEYKSDTKLNGTYIQGTKERLYRGKVHPTYLIHGTTTGRLSARNPNTQNVAGDLSIKRMFVSSGPDRSLVHADYSQAELRIVSWLAGDMYFRDIFNDGTRDLFDELIVEVFPGSNKELEDPFEWKHNKRRKVKAMVYGLGYGLTEYGLARQLEISVDEAQAMMEKFFEVIPEVVQWQKNVKRQVLDGHNLVTPFGRHRRYSLITNENKRSVLNEALAFLPQSTASDTTVSAAIVLNKKLFKTFGPEVRIINLVHDDIIADCPDDIVEDVEQMLRNEMLSAAYKVVGDYVKFDVGTGYAKSWDKML